MEKIIPAEIPNIYNSKSTAPSNEISDATMSNGEPSYIADIDPL